ncbi:DUF58 domain-containing protein [Nitriliruptor alkaliphilus]|uniref:DUF58 domain-containing protein n=1 Tax=Nitriliruptor alkaliphilus TaxID=427918 RepID=UPI000697DD72|nr:DUF58 domain-containing protein [Nitriliruptor alkaliphilus]
MTAGPPLPTAPAPTSSLPLSAALIAQLGQHQLAPTRRVRGRFAGAHRSARLGSSADVADVREYVAGDDLRRIDRAASRRHGKLQVALTEAEDDAAAQVVVDRSASMAGAKASQSDRLVAGLAVLGARDGLRLWLATTPATGPGAGSTARRTSAGSGWARGQNALPTACTLLEAAPVPSGGEGPAGRPDLVAVVRRAARTSAQGPLLLVTDLLFDGWEEVIVAVGAARRDAVVLQVLGDDELAPQLDGDVRLVDAETGAEVEVGADDRTTSAYAAALRAHLTAVEQACTDHAIAHVLVPASADPGDVLLGDLRLAGVVR